MSAEVQNEFSEIAIKSLHNDRITAARALLYIASKADRYADLFQMEENSSHTDRSIEVLQEIKDFISEWKLKLKEWESEF